jgi:hypothetical protein
VAHYIQLLEAFLNRTMSALEFESAYLDMFKNDAAMQPGEYFDVLDRLFVAVDGFCADPSLIDDPRFDFDEEQLRAAATDALNRLSELSRGA